jgi:hypothetical protein
LKKAKRIKKLTPHTAAITFSWHPQLASGYGTLAYSANPTKPISTNSTFQCTYVPIVEGVDLGRQVQEFCSATATVARTAAATAAKVAAHLLQFQCQQHALVGMTVHG